MEEKKVRFSRRTRMIVSTVAILLALVGAVAGLTVGLRTQPPPNGGSPSVLQRRTAGKSKAFDSAYNTYRTAAVSTDTNICSQIGIDVLRSQGGSAVDAAIASMMCVGVVNAHSTGLGGGHFATIYDTPRGQSQKVLVSLIARERAPLFSYRDMFVNKTAASSVGGLAVAVPGEVSGFYKAWQMFGRVAWAQLVEPTALLCEQGFTVEADLSKAIKQYESTIRSDPNFAELFVKPNGSLIQEGDLLKNPKLAVTFRRIAADPLTYYNGTMAQEIVDDIREYGGNITLSDLAAYRSTIKQPINATLANGNYKLFNPPPPSSGAVLDFITGILDGYNFRQNDINDVASKTLTFHRIAEAFKFAYAKRSELGDQDYVNVTELVYNLTSSDYAESIRQQIDDQYTHDINYYGPTFDYVEDKGTVHLNILAPDGSAVAMSGTINLFFGAKVRGRRTGIIFNDEMDDFSTPGTVNSFGVPASPSNYIVPGKIPMSSMSPTIVLDANGTVVFMSGGSGGTRITTETGFVMMGSLWFNLDLKTATDTPRIHHQLAPNELNYEPDFEQAVLDGLIAKNHTTAPISSLAVVGSIRNRCPQGGSTCIEAVSDARKGGAPAGY